MTTPKRCVAAALVLAGCAAKSGDVSPACVSRLIYENYSCQQLAPEGQSISAPAPARKKKD